MHWLVIPGTKTIFKAASGGTVQNSVGHIYRTAPFLWIRPGAARFRGPFACAFLQMPTPVSRTESTASSDPF